MSTIWKTLRAVMGGSALALSTVVGAQQLLPQVPLISYDGPGNPPQPGIRFTADTLSGGLFQVNADAKTLQLFFDGAARNLSADATLKFTVDVQSNTGGANIPAAGVPGNDLEFNGSIDLNGDGIPEYSGLLLSAELLAFNGAIPVLGSLDQFFFTFRPSGGQLVDAGFYEGRDIFIPLGLEFSGGTPFTGTFAVSFSGNPKGSAGSVARFGDGGVNVGDFVFFDANNNGIQQPGERGLANVRVILRDENGEIVSVAFTGANGSYLFRAIPDGNYTIEVDQSTVPNNYQPTIANAGADDARDSDSVDGAPVPVTVAGANNLTIDFGFTTPATGAIGDFIFLDTDRDGIQDAGEPGIQGVTVTLTDSAGNVRTAVTDANGGYLFGGLFTDTYQVDVLENTLPPGLTPTQPNQGGNDVRDSDFPLNGGSVSVTLPTNSSINRTIDGGFVTPATGVIGDFVFIDQNGNGIQDPDEFDDGVDNVTINLMRDGQTIATTTTGPNGFYEFTGLSAGEYTIMIVDGAGTPLAALTPSPANQGNDDSIDSDAVNGNITVTLVTDTEEDPTLDFGYVPPAEGRLGDFVFFDRDRDGVQDFDDTGISGVEVILLDANMNEIGRDTTDLNGAYLFSGLSAGDYKVQINEATLPAGFLPTLTNAGADDTLDSDGPQNGDAVMVNLPVNNSEDLTIDFGFVAPAEGRLGNFVFLDADNDGIQDAGELGLEGIRVQLRDDQGTLIAEQETNSDGTYLFEGLLAGTYTVDVVDGDLPAGYSPTITDAGNNDAIDSDGPQNGGAVTVVLPLDTSEDLTIDFGYVTPAEGRLGNFVFNDFDEDGIQDTGEDGIQAVRVELRDPVTNDLIAATFTDRNGFYDFSGLLAGDYKIVVIPPADAVMSPSNQGNDDAIDSDENGVIASLPTNQTVDNTYDFGFYFPELGRIGDFVWFDENANGIQDAGEDGIPGVTVELRNGTGTLLATDVTGAFGDYLFEMLPAGDYRVDVIEATLPNGFVLSPTDAGGDDTVDSDGPQNGRFVAVTLPLNNSEDLTIDFGYNRPAGSAIGDTVFFDANGNGVQDQGEPGIENVAVALRDLDNGNALVEVVRTDANGNYLFENLPAGRYRVTVNTNTLPNNDYVQTADPDGTLDNRAFSVTLGLNETNLDQDFGYTLPLGRLGDFVWLDLDADGIQDANENGIANVTVNLLQDGQVIATTQTGSQGEYIFEQLAAGTYQVDVVEATLPAGLQETTQNAGGDDAVDSDVNANGDAVTVVLAQNDSEDLTIDFGYVGTGSIGDTIWEDTDGDGVLDAGEEGIPTVTVKLQDAVGNQIATTVTDGNGNYSFDNLPAGDYIVMVDTTTIPAGFDPTFDLDGNLDDMTSVTLGAGEDFVDADFGYRPIGALGDFVFEDLNGNGQQDAGEPGVAGVTVNLTQNGQVIATDVTDGNGAYEFTGLPAGTYQVDIVEPAGFVPTLTNVGNDATDSDGPQNGGAVTVTLGVAEVNPTIDFGLVQLASLGDRVFLDNDRDGVQDAGEPGVANVTVQLLDENGNVLATQSTDNNGLYLFSNLAPGTYRVRFAEPANFDFTAANAGNDDTADSDANAVTGLSPFVTLNSGDSNLTIDAGLIPENNPNVCNNPVDIDFETNAAGNSLPRGTIIDDEYAALGITVSTSDPNNPAMIFDSSNPTGGDFDLGTPNQDFGGPGIGSGGAQGSAGANSVDLGNVLIISEDRDQNDPDDNVGGGVLIFTFDTPKDVLSIDVLDIDSNEGASVIRTYDANGNLLTATNIAGLGNNSVQSVAVNSLNVSRLEVEFAASGAITGLHFCMDNQQGNGASIGDRVFLDSSGDGVQDAGEPGIGGVVVQLLDENGNLLQTRVTDDNGNYLFDQLPAGNYRVVVDAGTLDPTFIQTFELDGIRNGKVDVTLAANQALLTVDFGYLPFVDCDVCDGGVTTLTFTNNGPAANITAVNDGQTLFSGNVPTGGTFTVSGQQDDGKFDKNELELRVNGTLVGEAHLSCSQPIGVGTEFGVLEVTEGASRDGGAFCPVPFNCGECEGGVTNLTFVNNGPSGTVKVTNNGDTLFNSFVATGGTFSVSGQDSDGKFANNDVELFFNGTLVGEAHVSCSQPIAAGTEFGPFEVTDGASRDGGDFCPIALACDECAGGVTSLSLEFVGAANANVRLVDKSGERFSGLVRNGDVISVSGTESDGKFDGDLQVFINGTLVDELHLSCSDPLGVGTVVANGNFSVVEGSSKDGGAFCPFPLNCMECDGGVTSLTFSYDGPSAFVQAKNDGVVLFTGSLSNGDTFTIDGTKDDGKFENNDVELFVNGTLVGTPHVSCSQPIDNGTEFGPFTVVAGASRDGGQFCPIPGTPPVTPPGEEFCPDEALADQFGNGGGHAMIWFGLGSFVFEDAKWNELGNGTATLTGTLVDSNNPGRRFAVDALATGYTTVAPAGSPKLELNGSAYASSGGSVDPENWVYYTGFTGMLAGLGDYAGASVDFSRRGPALQVGVGASGKNIKFGASTWINFVTTAQSTGSATLPSSGQGDFNLDFDDCGMDRNCMVANGVDIGNTGGNNSSSYNDGEWTVNSDGSNWGSNDGHHYVYKTVTGDTEIVARLTSLQLSNNEWNRAGVMIRDSLSSNAKNVATNWFRNYSAIDLSARWEAGGSTSSGGWTESVTLPVWHRLSRVGNTFTAYRSNDGVNWTRIAGTTVSMSDEVVVGIYVAGHEWGVPTTGKFDNVSVDGLAIKDICGTETNTASVGDTVWQDQNANGILDAGEAGITGVVVNLLDANGNQIATTTTDVDGKYVFADLATGGYTVMIDTSTVPADLLQTFELDNSFDGNVAVSLGRGEDRNDVDFGYYNPNGDCGVCSGGVTSVTLKNTKTYARWIKIKQDDVHGNRVVTFDQQVPAGGTFTINGLMSDGTIGHAYWIFIDGYHAGDPRTDCSQDLQIGDEVAHRIEVVGGASSDGGPFCPAPVDTSKGEVGQLTVLQNDAHQWHTVQLERTYENPVIIMSMATANSAEPITLRTRHAGSTSFQFQVDEWNYQNGYHPSEIVNYMVIEAGEHTLANGAKLVAGSLTTANADEHWVNFGTTFANTPVVMAQVGHDNSTDAAVTRIRNVSTTGFKVMQQEEEALSGGRPAGTVYYIAIDKGVSGGNMKFEVANTGDNRTHHWSTINFGQSYDAPVVFAGMQTRDGGDTANTRQRWLMSNSVEVLVEEEQSADDELGHTSEDIGYFVFEPGLID